MADTEKLKDCYDFLDGMADKEVPEKKPGIVSTVVEGALYGSVLGPVCYTVGTMAQSTFPAVFPGTYGAMLGVIGFVGAVAIAYHKDLHA